MGSTSVHLPDNLLKELDELAAESGTSRNRLIVRACQVLVTATRKSWPAGFFRDDHLDERDLAELKAGGKELLEAITRTRRSRKKVSL